MPEFDPSAYDGHEVPDPSTQQADIARWHEELFPRSVAPEHVDRAITSTMDDKIDVGQIEAEAEQRRSEALARVDAVSAAQMPAQVSRLDEELAYARDHREQEQAGVAIGQLTRNIFEMPAGQLPVMDRGPENVRQPAIDEIYTQLNLVNPITELQADNRSLLGKIFRRPNRTSQVRRKFVLDDTPGIITATRFYSKTDKQYLIRLDGGRSEDKTVPQQRSDVSRIR